MPFLLLILLCLASWADELDNSNKLAQAYIHKIKKSNNSLVRFNNEIQDENGTVYLFVQGIEMAKGQQWLPALDFAIQKKMRFYFHKIYNQKSLRKNVALIKDSISQVQQLHPNNRIEIMAYSAGGAATLVAWSDLEMTRSKRLFLTTIASPLSGYGAPKIFVPFVYLLFGALNAKISRGLQSELNGRKLSQCRHFVNMNCFLDQHSCSHKGTANTQLLPLMPCGNEQITEFYNETHESILETAVKLIIE